MRAALFVLFPDARALAEGAHRSEEERLAPAVSEIEPRRSVRDPHDAAVQKAVQIHEKTPAVQVRCDCTASGTQCQRPGGFFLGNAQIG